MKKVIITCIYALVCVLLFSCTRKTDQHDNSVLSIAESDDISFQCKLDTLCKACSCDYESLARILMVEDSIYVSTLVSTNNLPEDEFGVSIDEAYENYIECNYSYKKFRRHYDPQAIKHRHIFIGISLSITIIIAIILFAWLIIWLKTAMRCPHCGSRRLYDTQMSDGMAGFLAGTGAFLYHGGKAVASTLAKGAVQGALASHGISTPSVLRSNNSKTAYRTKEAYNKDQAKWKAKLTRVKHHCKRCGHTWTDND